MKLIVAFIQFILIGLALAQSDPKKEKLVSLASEGSGLIKLNSNSYDRFTEGKRNYGMVVLLTATDAQFNCLGLMSAPNVFYFPPQEAGQNKEYVKYELAKHGFTAESFAEFLTNESGHKVKVTRPINYTVLGGKIFLAVGAAAILKLLYRNFGSILSHKNTWALISILFILTMNSGYMWNRIRNPPYIMPGPNGQLNYIASGFSNQYGVEAQLVAGIYGSLALSLGALIISVPKLNNQAAQRTGAYVWMAAVIFIFSCLLALFKIKNGGYPFKLFI
ncbi:hypothetical protein K501DRAFT_329833 [Backusella circina FSU 941]|nr:hypothetical protein K501DRAFT_329833 [Backusella circina FSU 941]